MAAPPLVWLDLEMTGLDPDGCRILEIAVLTTDSDLILLPGEYHAVIRQPPSALRGLSRTVRKMHASSGLLERVRSSSISQARAEKEALAFVKTKCGPGEGILAGNSVHVDRRFLLKHMPKLAGYLHYRILDVSSVKELVRRWYPSLPPFPKQKTHTAMTDIRESIGELRYYRERVFRPAKG
jgi:oligoribonuclease